MATKEKDQVAILRKTKPLKIAKGGTVYKTRTRGGEADINDPGEPFNGNSLIGSSENVTPHWDSLKNEWAFDGTIEDLKELQKRLKLRHKKSNGGKIITIEDDELTNPESPFWGNVKLWSNLGLILEEGSLVLTSRDPMTDLLRRVQSARRKVYVQGKKQSKDEIADSKYTLELPEIKNKLERAELTKEIEAIKALESLDHADRLKVVSILDPAGWTESIDAEDEVFNILYKEGVKNTNTSRSRFEDGATYQEKFIEIAKRPRKELNILDVVSKAYRKGGIRKRQTGYVNFENSQINGGKIKTHKQLFEYFLSTDAKDEYNKIKDWVENN